MWEIARGFMAAGFKCEVGWDWLGNGNWCTHDRECYPHFVLSTFGIAPIRDAC